MKVLGVIPARGGSKGLPGKNIKPLGGIPLIAHTILTARDAACLDRIWVSTEDPRIAKVAEDYGVPVPWLRPPELAGDDSRIEDALLHLLARLKADEQYQPDGVMILQPTSPFRTAATVRKALSLFDAGHSTVMSVTLARQHPAWCYRIDSQSGFLLPFQEDAGRPLPRQKLPDAYVLDGAIFVFSVPSFLERHSIFVDPNYPLVLPPEEAVDIDTPFDWAVAEGLWANRATLQSQAG